MDNINQTYKNEQKHKIIYIIATSISMIMTIIFLIKMSLAAFIIENITSIFSIIFIKCVVRKNIKDKQSLIFLIISIVCLVVNILYLLIISLLLIGVFTLIILIADKVLEFIRAITSIG